MCVDWIKHAYTTRVKFWKDDDTEVEIAWYRCCPGAKDLPGVSPFRSYAQWAFDSNPPGRMDNSSRFDIPYLTDHWQFPDLGEQKLASQTTYSRGENVWGFMGNGYCGSIDAWHRGGIHGVDPELHVIENGGTDCCPPLGLDVAASWEPRGMGAVVCLGTPSLFGNNGDPVAGIADNPNLDWWASFDRWVSTRPASTRQRPATVAAAAGDASSWLIPSAWRPRTSGVAAAATDYTSEAARLALRTTLAATRILWCGYPRQDAVTPPQHLTDEANDLLTTWLRDGGILIVVGIALNFDAAPVPAMNAELADLNCVQRFTHGDFGGMPQGEFRFGPDIVFWDVAGAPGWIGPHFTPPPKYGTYVSTPDIRFFGGFAEMTFLKVLPPIFTGIFEYRAQGFHLSVSGGTVPTMIHGYQAVASGVIVWGNPTGPFGPGEYDILYDGPWNGPLGDQQNCYLQFASGSLTATVTLSRPYVIIRYCEGSEICGPRSLRVNGCAPQNPPGDPPRLCPPFFTRSCSVSGGERVLWYDGSYLDHCDHGIIGLVGRTTQRGPTRQYPAGILALVGGTQQDRGKQQFPAGILALVGSTGQHRGGEQRPAGILALVGGTTQRLAAASQFPAGILALVGSTGQQRNYQQLPAGTLALLGSTTQSDPFRQRAAGTLALVGSTTQKRGGDQRPAGTLALLGSTTQTVV